MAGLLIDLSHPLVASATGAGVLVAVVDSGIYAAHPHVQGVQGGIALVAEGGDDSDYADRIGHGTAVAAAIREKAPAADLYAVRIFRESLSAPAEVLARAIGHAAEAGARLINLSLGTPRRDMGEVLRRAVAGASERGAVVVAAAADGETAMYPGSLSNSVGVDLDASCPRDAVRFGVGPETRFAASGLPRPIPGVPPARNLQGISFAVANVTGVLARVLQDRPDITGPASIADALR